LNLKNLCNQGDLWETQTYVGDSQGYKAFMLLLRRKKIQDFRQVIQYEILSEIKSSRLIRIKQEKK